MIFKLKYRSLQILQSLQTIYGFESLGYWRYAYKYLSDITTDFVIFTKYKQLSILRNKL